MPRLRLFPVVLLLAAAAMPGLAACGGGEEADLLPGGTASEINANLDRVEQLADEGDCAGASEAAEAVSVQVEELGGVDAKLKQALREGAARLNEVVAGCEEATTEAETVPAIEAAEEPEEEEKEREKDKEKAEKPDESQAEKEAEETEEEANPTLPPQAEGEAKGHEKQEEAPPAESGGGTPSGGLGPGTPAQGE